MGFLKKLLQEYIDDLEENSLEYEEISKEVSLIVNNSIPIIFPNLLLEDMIDSYKQDIESLEKPKVYVKGDNYDRKVEE